MALFSFHCQNYKAGALVGIDGHNRRLHKNHKSNPDIDNERSVNNIVYVAPKKNLYADCKAIVVNGRFCPQSVRNFCPIVAGFNAGTYKVPACVL